MTPDQLPPTGRRQIMQFGLRSLADLARRTAGAYLAGYEEANPQPVPPVRTRVRPPGARPEPEFLGRCTRCDECIRACPFEALGRDQQGYPWLWDPAAHPCYMCDGFPCIAACAPVALTFADRRLRTIGLAVVDAASCLAHLGEPCSSCRDACRDVRAIRLEDGLPIVDPTSCTGCGVCIGKCPAPGRAIGAEVRGLS